jgi:4a-hydroxytetrahydrobiopterin dehydratase
MGSELLTGDQIAELRLAHWRPLQDSLLARFATGNFATGLAFVNRIGAIAEEANHHPDLDLRYGHVAVRLTSHDAGGKTARDVELARRISEVAVEFGLDAQTEKLSVVDFGLDTWDAPQVSGFWAAILGTQETPDHGEVVDPDRVVPCVWFQDTDQHETPRQRWHPDIWVPPEVVTRRIEAAVAAGGQVVDESQQPRFVVLADPQGNRVCLCTHVTRDQ